MKVLKFILWIAATFCAWFNAYNCVADHNCWSGAIAHVLLSMYLMVMAWGTLGEIIEDEERESKITVSTKDNIKSK